MKKIGTGILGIIILIMFIVSCGGTPKASSPDELDMAIRDASDYLNDNIPAGSKIVILNVQSDSTALSDYIIDELIANAVNDRLFEVVDRQQLDLIRAEQNFQWAGEVDDKLALEVGKFFGAQVIVSGRVSQVSNRYRFTIRALEVQTARVVGQNNINIAAGATITALMRSDGSGGTASVSTSGGRSQTGTTSPSSAGGQTAQAATPAAIANGTYTFWPRPRAKLNGMPVNTYLVKIAVSGRFMLFYFTTTERGISSSNPQGIDNSFQRWPVLLSNLDRPSQTWNPVSYAYNSNNNNEGSLLSFEGVTATRFKLELSDNIYFDEIILADAEYEP